ncbi:hypothetical protein RCZ04_16240 [Capnocytophaga sp. HP1101]
MNNIQKILFFATIITLFSACSDDEFNEIDGALLKDPNFSTNVFTATISVSQIKESAVQTNGLGGYLLGQYTQAPFGTKSATIVAQVTLPAVNPIFGAKAQATENSENKSENETVTEAYLYVPFFNPNSSNSNASYSQNGEYTLDSIYGNKDANFQVNVRELNYFLSDIDTDLNAKIYYSNNSDITSNLGASIVSNTTASNTYTISNKAITRYQFDNPQTTDDESKNVQDVLAPGLRIPLSTDFFQTKIINKEGSSELTNANDFKKYFKGIAISASNFSKDLMMLLNMANAKIEIVYSYETSGTNTTTTETRKNRYELSLSGITVNLFNNSGENVTDSSKIYLSGALGQTASITISDADIANIKSQKLMITDASLLLYVDNSVSYAKEPDRLFIYNTQTGAILVDYQYDPTSTAESSAYSYLYHLGKLQKENGKGAYYQIRITNHILNLINEVGSNVPLGIAVASNVRYTNSGTYLSDANAKGKILSSAVITPLSTVIKDVKLRISYTQPK